MNETLKKIDEEILSATDWVYVDGLKKAKEIIQAEQRDHMTDYYQVREIIKQYCQNEDCTEDCKECPHTLSVIRCGEEAECKGECIKTKGDVIRESNESLAYKLAEMQAGRIGGEQVTPCKKSVDEWIDYLNQPVESVKKVLVEKHIMHIQV